MQSATAPARMTNVPPGRTLLAEFQELKRSGCFQTEALSNFSSALCGATIDTVYNSERVLGLASPFPQIADRSSAEAWKRCTFGTGAHWGHQSAFLKRAWKFSYYCFLNASPKHIEGVRAMFELRKDPPLCLIPANEILLGVHQDAEVSRLMIYSENQNINILKDERIAASLDQGLLSAIKTALRNPDMIPEDKNAILLRMHGATRMHNMDMVKYAIDIIAMQTEYLFNESLNGHVAKTNNRPFRSPIVDHLGDE